MTPSKRAGGLIALLVTIALIVSACSSSGSSSSTSGGSTGGSSASNSSSSQPTSNVTGTPFVLGSICSCTGSLAGVLGQSLNVLGAWVKWTNAHNGINGHPVKLVTYDDGENPTTALADAKLLVEQDHVQAIVGETSLLDTDWASYVDKKGIPVIGGEPADAVFFTDPNFFISGTNTPVLLLAELMLAKEAGKKHVGVFYCAETPVCASVPTIFTALAKPLGITISSAKVSSSATNYLSSCLSFKQSGVDAVFAAVPSDVVPRVIDSCAQQGFKPTNLASSQTTEKSWLSDSNLDGSVIGATDANYSDPSVPGVKQFLDAMTTYLPKLQSSPQFSWPLLSAWAGAQLFAAAAKAGKLTPASTPAQVKASMYLLKNETLDGIAPPLNYQAGKPGFPLCFFTALLKNKAFVTTNGGKTTCISAAEAAGLQKALGG